MIDEKRTTSPLPKKGSLIKPLETDFFEALKEVNDGAKVTRLNGIMKMNMVLKKMVF